MLMQDLIPVLQLSVSPVILISGVALILLSMSNRYGHILDKTRSLSSMFRKSSDDDSDHLYTQLRILYARARVLRWAIFLASLSLLMAAILISILFLASLLHLEAALVIVALFIGCMFTISASLIIFLTDVNMSLKALSLEINSHTKQRT